MHQFSNHQGDFKKIYQDCRRSEGRISQIPQSLDPWIKLLPVKEEKVLIPINHPQI
jgi:hypothetical protein